MIKKVCVAGAGTMGSGIALSAAQNRFDTVIYDTQQKGIDAAKLAVNKNLDFLVGKQKISPAEKENFFHKIQFTTDISDCTGDIIIEAIIENPEVKEKLFKSIA